jgi:hypothetical protein
MAIQAGLLNAQIPMSAKVQQPDGLGSYMRGVEAKGELKDLAAADQQRDLVAKDHAVVQDYLAQGGELYTPVGQEKAVADLKGKISSKSYMGLIDHAEKSKAADIKMREGLSKLTEQDLTNRQTQLEKGLTYIAQPLQTYEEAVKVKGEQGAAADLETSKGQILAAMSAEKNPVDGSPAFPPTMLETMKNATPAQLRAMLATTKYQKDVNLQHLQQTQARRNEALAAFDEARAKATTEGGGLTRGAPSDVAKIDADVKAGRITAEQGKQMIDGIVAKKSKGSDVSNLSADALERAANDHYIDGTLPARLNAFERSQIMNKAAEIATQAGDNAEAGTIRKSANKASKAALAIVTRQEQMTSVFERDADKRLSLVLDLAKKADLSGSPALNRWIRAGRSNIAGDADVNNLNSAMISLQAELAKVLSGALGNAGVSDAARSEAAQIINANMSPDMLDSLAPNIRKELKFKLDSFKEQKQQLTDSLKVPGGGTPLRRAGDQGNGLPASGTVEQDKEAGRQAARSEYSPDRGGIERAKRDLADIDKGLKDAKGDAVGILKQARSRVATAIAELEKGGGSKPSAKPSWSSDDEKRLKELEAKHGSQ